MKVKSKCPDQPTLAIECECGFLCARSAHQIEECECGLLCARLAHQIDECECGLLCARSAQLIWLISTNGLLRKLGFL